MAEDRKMAVHKRNRIEFWVFLVLLMGIAIAFCCAKKDFFTDEMAQYGLSNSYYNPFLRTIYDNNLDDNIIYGKDLMNYIVVNKGERFAYDSVYYNQTQDVHPPLYYMVTHTICSVFYGTFSKWTGLVPNLIFLALMLAILYQFGVRLFESHKIGIMLMILYGTSTSATSNYTMVRMYQPLALLTLLLAYELLRLLQSDRPRLIYPAIFATVCAGMLTHYFYLFYAFFVCAFVFFYLLGKKCYKKLWRFSVSALLGVGAMVLIYPYILTSLSGQGNLSVDYSLKRCVTDIIRMTLYMGRGMLLCAVVGGIGILILFYGAIKNKKTQGKRLAYPKNTEYAVLLLVPAVLAFLVIALVGPLERYAFHLTPFVVLFAGLIWAFVIVRYSAAGKVLDSNLMRVCYMVIAFCMVWFVYQPKFLYRDAVTSYEIAKQYHTSPCVYMNGTNAEVGIVGNLIQMSYFDDICLQANPWSDKIVDYIEAHPDNETVVIYIAERIDAADDDDEVNIIKSRLSKEYSAELVRFGDFTRMYVLRAVEP